MGLTERIVRTHRIVCDVNYGCGGESTGWALTPGEAEAQARDLGFTHDWGTGLSLWVCAVCQPKHYGE